MGVGLPERPHSIPSMKTTLRQSSLTILAASLPAFSALAVDFVKEVQPLLETRCLECHNPDKVKGDLLMDTLANMLKGGENGPLLVAGNADKSLLIERIVLPKGHDDIMPPKGEPMTPAEVPKSRMASC